MDRVESEVELICEGTKQQGRRVRHDNTSCGLGCEALSHTKKSRVRKCAMRVLIRVG